MLRNAVALTVVLVALWPTGCSLLSHEAPSEDVDKAAALFFQRLNDADYDTIYNDASKGFKENKTRQTVTDNLKQLTEHGRLLTYGRLSMTFQGEGKERMAVPVYGASFERLAGEITLYFRDEGGEWKLFGFALKNRRQ